MKLRTAYQRGAAACTLLRDLQLRATNPVTREVCEIVVTLLSAPAPKRAAIEGRALEMVAAAEARWAKYVRAMEAAGK